MPKIFQHNIFNEQLCNLMYLNCQIIPNHYIYFPMDHEYIINNFISPYWGVEYGVLMRAKYQVYKDVAGKYRFRLRAANNKIVAVSEAYESKAGCMNGIKSVQSNCESHVEEETKNMEELVNQKY